MTQQSKGPGVLTYGFTNTSAASAALILDWNIAAASASGWASWGDNTVLLLKGKIASFGTSRSEGAECWAICEVRSGTLSVIEQGIIFKTTNVSAFAFNIASGTHIQLKITPANTDTTRWMCTLALEIGWQYA